jgi:hypothetical protein
LVGALEEELAFVFVDRLEEGAAGVVQPECWVIADVVDVACFDVEAKEEGVAVLVHDKGLALVDGTEVVNAGIDILAESPRG